MTVGGSQLINEVIEWFSENDNINYTRIYTSSNPEVVNVNQNGEIQALSEGTAVIS